MSTTAPEPISLRLMRAAKFASERHANQRRKGANGAPYVNHLIEVTAMLAEAVGDSDPDLLIAALLHDSIEDVGVRKEEIVELFGAGVAELVDLVTDDKTLEKQVRKRLQVENAPKKSRRAQWLKIADKTSNLITIRDCPPEAWSLERRREYLAWARSVVTAFPEPHPLLLERFLAVAAELESIFDTCGNDGAEPQPDRPAHHA